MEINILHDLITIPVARSTRAPWLKDSATKVMTVYPFIFHVVDKERDIDETIVIPAGYVLDWSSIPRLLWTMYPPNYSEARRGAAAHDYLYSHLYRYFDKGFADDLLVAFMEKEDASRFACFAFHKAVKVGGRGGWAQITKRNPHPHWSRHHEKIPYDSGCEVSTSPFATPQIA